MKAAIVRALPASESYKLISSHHTGGLENAECCANCGRAIVEVAILADSQGNSHRVGMDCAETLTSDTWTLGEHKAAFADTKTFAAALRKSRKADPVAPIVVGEYGESVGYYKQGGFSVQIGQVDKPGYLWRNLPLHLKPYIMPVIEAAQRTAGQ